MEDNIPQQKLEHELMEIAEDEQTGLVVPNARTNVAHFPTNIDTNTMRGKATLLRVMGPSEYKIEAGQCLPMLATHWLMMPDVVADEKTGEVREIVRVVLIDKHGKHFRTSSAHMPFRLRALLELFSAEEWADGIPLIISTRPSTKHRGSVYHDIQIDIAAI